MPNATTIAATTVPPLSLSGVWSRSVTAGLLVAALGAGAQALLGDRGGAGLVLGGVAGVGLLSATAASGVLRLMRPATVGALATAVMAGTMAALVATVAAVVAVQLSVKPPAIAFVFGSGLAWCAGTGVQVSSAARALRGSAGLDSLGALAGVSSTGRSATSS